VVGDTYFPGLPDGEWLVHRESTHVADERNEHAFTVERLTRRTDAAVTHYPTERAT
jgi:hypothetical protein